MSVPRFALLFWPALALLAGAGLFHTLAGGGGTVEPLRSRQAARLDDPAEPRPAAEVAPLGAAMVARPLFSRSRRPPEPAPAAAAGTTDALPRLIGTMRRDGRMVALFRMPGDDSLQRVLEEDRIGPWRILAIRHGGARISDGRRELDIVVWTTQPAAGR